MIYTRKILCAVDVDDNSPLPIRYARDIAQSRRATVYLLHVARTPAPDMDAPVAIGPRPHWEQAAQRSLERIARESLDDSVAYEVVVRGGIPETVITEVAAELEVDLIVMATHGRTGLAHLFFGSVAETVVREAPCPVLVVKPKITTAGASAIPRNP
jgi:universal stress protein A